jgi:hypothetical protein
MDEAVGGFEQFDGQSRLLGKHAQLPIDHDHAVRAFDDIRDLESQVRKRRPRRGGTASESRPCHGRARQIPAV